MVCDSNAKFTYEVYRALPHTHVSSTSSASSASVHNKQEMFVCVNVSLSYIYTYILMYLFLITHNKAHQYSLSHQERYLIMQDISKNLYHTMARVFMCGYHIEVSQEICYPRCSPTTTIQKLLSNQNLSVMF